MLRRPRNLRPFSRRPPGTALAQNNTRVVPSLTEAILGLYAAAAISRPRLKGRDRSDSRSKSGTLEYWICGSSGCWTHRPESMNCSAQRENR